MQDPGAVPPPIPNPSGDITAGSIPPSGPAQINFDVIGRAWAILKPSLGVWVVAFIIYVVIIGGFSMLVGAVTGSAARPTFTPSAGGVPGAVPVLPTPNYPVMIVAQLIQFVVSQFLIGGLYRMAINQVRSGQLNLGDMFSVTDVLPALLGAAILTGLATVIGFLLCIIPGLLLTGLLMFTIPLVVDARLGATEAMSASWNALKDQMLMAVLFLIVIGLLAGAGVLLCFVGVLVTGPLAILALALLYRDFFPQPQR
jgi:hypothetical protein